MSSHPASIVAVMPKLLAILRNSMCFQAVSGEFSLTVKGSGADGKRLLFA